MHVVSGRQLWADGGLVLAGVAGLGFDMFGSGWLRHLYKRGTYSAMPTALDWGVGVGWCALAWLAGVCCVWVWLFLVPLYLGVLNGGLVNWN